MDSSQPLAYFNFSSRVLTEYEALSLSMGLRHVFIPPDNSRDEFFHSSTNFVRSLALKWIHRYRRSQFEFLPSLYTKVGGDRPSTTPDLDAFLTRKMEDIRDAVILDANPTVFRKSFHQRNIEGLARDPNIIITSSDKNLGLCIFDTAHYNELVYNTLESKAYKKLSAEQFDILAANAVKFLDWFFKYYKDAFEGLNPQFWNYLQETFNFERQAPYFRILPKLHKMATVILNSRTLIPVRPIVASTNWITTNASKVLTEFLNPVMRKLPYILKDSRELVRNNDNVHVLPKHSLVFTIDIVNFYGNMLKDTVISQLRAYNIWASESNDLYGTDYILIPEWAIQLTHWILSNNVFTFEEACYLQVDGMAMGTNFAVVLANIFGFTLFEMDPLHSARLEALHMYGRYIDDIIGIWTLPEIDFVNFANFYNSRDNNIKVTWTISRRLPFLDLYITLTPLSTFQDLLTVKFSCYQKPLNKYSYLTDASQHPKSLKRGFIKGELIRYVRNSSRQEDFVNMSFLFRHRLSKRGYSRQFLNTIFPSVTYAERQSYLQVKAKDNEVVIPFIIRHSARLNRIKLGLILQKINTALPRFWMFAEPPRVILSRTSNKSIQSTTSRYRHNRLKFPAGRIDLKLATWIAPGSKLRAPKRSRAEAFVDEWMEEYAGLEIDLNNLELPPQRPIDAEWISQPKRRLSLDSQLANMYERKRRR